MRMNAPGIEMQRQLDRRWRVTFRGRPVQNPVLRRLIITTMICLMPPLLMLMMVVCFALDPVLKGFGFRGCIIDHPDGNYSLDISRDSFRAVS